MRLFGLLAAVVLMFACGGTTTLNGSLDGRFLPVKRSVVGTFAGPGNGTFILLTAADRPCEALKDNVWGPGTTLVSIVLKERTGGQTFDGTKAGTYRVSSSTEPPEGLSARVTVEQFNGECESSLPTPSNTVATSGTVTVDSEIQDKGSASGRYAIQFPGGSAISGQFAADHCAQVGALGAPACGEPSVPGLPLTVEVLRTGAGTGSVTSVPSGIDCLPTCAASFPNGRAVLTATPALDGATFEGWSGACSGTGPCTLVRTAEMDANQTVTATFGQLYSGSFSGSGSFTRPVTYGTCTWNSSFTGTASLRLVGWENGVLTGTMRIQSDRSEGQGTPSDPRQTCTPGSASYDDTQPISGTPSAITWSASPLASSSFLSGSFTGAVSGNTGMLGGNSVSGNLVYSALPPSSGSANIQVTMTK